MDRRKVAKELVVLARKMMSADKGFEFESEADYEKAVDKFFSEVNSGSELIQIVKNDKETGYHTQQGRGDFSLTNIRLQFDVRMIVNDPYVDSAKYDKGEAYIYTSRTFTSVCERAAQKYFGAELKWNNTGSVGWMSYLIIKGAEGLER